MSAETSQLKRDLAAFADPGTEVGVERTDGGWWRATWIENGVDRAEEFQITDGSATAVSTEQGAQSYASFLAGPSMANLRGLARNTLQVIAGADAFVEPRARMESAEPYDGAATEILHRAAEPARDRAVIAFVAADAGVGKSVLLREIVRQKAAAYLEGSSSTLWLYVDAQARRLAALDEALASELDRLRARFAFDAAIPLIRTGALVLVVDGFDELIGSVGAYDEAFNGLVDFIGQLDGSGALVAAARSSYYEQEFLARAGRSKEAASAWMIRPVRLRGWNADERRAFAHLAASERGIEEAVADVALERIERALAAPQFSSVVTRPFFVVRAIRLFLEGLDLEFDSTSQLLDRLVSEYVQREVTKLVAPGGRPLLSEEVFRDYYDQLAIEMWRQESRELSRATLSELTALLAEGEGLSDDDVREVVARAPHFAMLREGSSSGSVAWEHDVYFAYFLSTPLASALREGDSRIVGRLLRRGRLPEEAGMMAGDLLRDMSAQDMVDLLVAVSRSESIDRDRVGRNAGLLVGGRIAGIEVSGLRIYDLLIGDISLGATVLEDCELEAVEFAGTDLSSAKFVNSRATNPVLFDRVLVNPDSTVLDIVGLSTDSFMGLSVRSEESDRAIFAPSELRAVLRSCSLPSAAPEVVAREVEPVLRDLVERIAKLFSKSNVVIEGTDDDDYLQNAVTTHREWSRTRRALVDAGVLVPRTKQASGNKVFLERTVSAEELLAGLDSSANLAPEVAKFWDDVTS